MRITILVLLSACGGGGGAPLDASSTDAAVASCMNSSGSDGGASDLAGAPGDMAMSPLDAGILLCDVDGNRGQCLDTAVCGAQPSFSAYAGYCPGPANIQCCVPTPNVANNAPIESGWTIMQQAMVTPEMTTWAVAILRDPTDYPLFTTALRIFSTVAMSVPVLARVEWHPPDFQNNVVHRGVTLYTH